MFEICDYKEKNVLGVVDLDDEVVEWFNENRLRSLCNSYNIEVGGLFKNGLTLCPSYFEMDDESADTCHRILSMSKDMVDLLKASNISYSYQMSYYLEAHKSFFGNDDWKLSIVIYNNGEYVDHVYLNTGFLKKFHSETGIWLDNYCAELLEDCCKNTYFKKVMFS